MGCLKLVKNDENNLEWLKNMYCNNQKKWFTAFTSLKLGYNRRYAPLKENWIIFLEGLTQGRILEKRIEYDTKYYRFL